MSEIDKSEQWKLQGDCNLCRRKNYCSHRCTEHKRRVQMMMSSMINRAINEVLAERSKSSD